MKRAMISAVLLFSLFLILSVFAALKPENDGSQMIPFSGPSPPVNISQSLAASSYPLLGLDVSGAAYAVWVESLSAKDFYFSTNKSGSWATPEDVEQIIGAPVEAGFASFAVSSSGACHLTFHDTGAASYDIFHIPYENGWGQLTNISFNDGGSAYPACALNPVDDCLYVVWMDGTVLEWDIYLKYRDPSGTWSQVRRLPIGLGYTPDIGIDAKGTAHLVWATRGWGNSTVWYSKNRTPQGSSQWTQPLIIKSSTSEDFCYPKVDCDNAGNAYVIWMDGNAGNDEIYFRKVASDGTPAEEVNVSRTSGPSQEGALAVNKENGHAYVAWQESGDIFLNALIENWAGATNLTGGAALSSAPSIAVESSDKVHVAYAAMPTRNWEILYLTTYHGVPPPTTTTTSTTTTSTTTTTSIPIKAKPPLEPTLDTWPDTTQTWKINTLVWYRNPENKNIELESYRIYRKRAERPDSDMALIASIPADTYRFEDAGLPLSQKFTYGMTAVPKDGIESDISAFITEAGIFPPLSITCRTAINNALFRSEKINMISWQENPLNESGAVTRYNIYRRRSTQEDSEYQKIASVDGNVLEYWDRKLSLGEKYYYVVTAVNPGGGESRTSNPAKESS